MHGTTINHIGHVHTWQMHCRFLYKNSEHLQQQFKKPIHLLWKKSAYKLICAAACQFMLHIHCRFSSLTSMRKKIEYCTLEQGLQVLAYIMPLTQKTKRLC